VHQVNVVVAYAVCAFVWGTTWFAIRVCIGPDGYPTFVAAALRFTLAAVILAPLLFTRIVRPMPRGRAQWRWLIAAGLLNAIGYSLVYLGEERISGGLAAVLFGTEPLIIALLVTLTRTESVHRADVVGAIVSIVGIGVIFWDRLDVSARQAAGIALVSVAVVVSAVYSLIVKRQASDVHPLATSGVFLSVTAVALWVAAPFAGPVSIPWPPPRDATIALVYLGFFGSVVAFATFFYLLKRVSLMASMTLVFILPIIALVVDWLWEDDVVMVGRTYVGVSITLSGVLVSLIVRRQSAQAASR